MIRVAILDDHPAVLAGVWDHSSFRGDMLGRLRRTARFIAVTSYGSREDAEAIIAKVRDVHGRIRGTLPDGTPYAADEPVRDTPPLEAVFHHAALRVGAVQHGEIAPLQLLPEAADADLSRHHLRLALLRALPLLLRQLLHGFEKSAYVGYTATPFANIFVKELDGAGGNDVIKVDRSVTQPADLMGGDGDDKLVGCGGAAALIARLRSAVRLGGRILHDLDDRLVRGGRLRQGASRRVARHRDPLRAGSFSRSRWHAAARGILPRAAACVIVGLLP